MAGTELAVGYVSLAASGRGFGRSIVREASTAGDAAATNFGSRFTSGMAHWGKRAAQAFTLGIGAAGLFGIKVAADFQQTRIAFEGILGDVDKANALLGDLRDFAAKTPFEFTGLAESAKQLLAVGFSSEDILPTMETLGNVAATLGVGETEISGVVRALGQMKGKGKASAEELQQISEQIPGFSAIAAIAETMGITTAEAFDLMAKGAIPADDAIEAILTGMENFPGASGAMDRQSKTLNGVLSTLKDTVSGIAIDFITPYLPALSTGVAAFGGFLTDMAEDLKGFIASEAFQSFKTSLEGVVSKGLEAIKAWWDRNGEDIINFFTGLADTAGRALGTIGAWIWLVVLPALKKFGGWLISDGPGAELAITGIALALGLYAVNALIAAGATLIAAAPFILAAVAIGLLAWATGELIDKFDLLPKASEGLNAIVRHVIVPFIEQVQAAVDLVNELLDLLAKIPNIPGLSGDAGGIQIFPWQDQLPWGDDGMVMPGPRGVHSLAWIAGGETVLPTHKAELSSLLGGSGEGKTEITIMGYPQEDALSATERALQWHRTILETVGGR